MQSLVAGAGTPGKPGRWCAAAVAATTLAINLGLHPVRERRPSVAAPSMKSASTSAQPASNEPPQNEPQSITRASAVTRLDPNDARAAAIRLLAARFAASTDAELPELAISIAKLGGRDAHDFLLRSAHSDRPAASSAAFAALTKTDTPQVREFMLEELRLSGSAEAVSYFTDSVEPRAVPDLERLARTSVAELRTAAITALFAQGQSASAAVERLVQDDPEVANAVLDTPGRPTALLPALRGACITRLRAGSTNSGPVFDFLAQDLSDDSREALVAAARDRASADSALSALSTRGDAASLAAVNRLASDADVEIASRAACAAVSRPDSRSRDALVRASRGPLAREAAQALVQIGAPEGTSALENVPPRRNAWHRIRQMPRRGT